MVFTHTMGYRVSGVPVLMGSVLFGFCSSDSDCLRVPSVPVFLFLHPFLGDQSDCEVLQIISMNLNEQRALNLIYSSSKFTFHQ